MTLKWKLLDEKYLDYLRNNFEKRIPITQYGADKFKPFFGSLFEVEDMFYVSQVSHPQARHLSLKQNIDFIKIYNPKDMKLVSVVNLNYMFPINKDLVTNLDYKDIDNCRTFKNQNERSDYINLLKIELSQLNSNSIQKKAQKIYSQKYSFPDSDLAKRCFDFRLLEAACRKYK